MAPWTLAAVGVVNVLTAVSFTVVGVKLAARSVPSRDRLAVRAIACWWLCMGLLLILQGSEVLAAAAGRTDLGVSTFVRYANGLLLGAGGWGLSFHVLYLRTGRTAWAGWLAPYFALVALAYCATIVLHPLVGLEPTGHDLVGQHEPPLEGSVLWNVVVALVGLPLIAAATLYLLLSRRLGRRDQKRRAVLASTGILAWVGAGLVVQIVAGQIADFLGPLGFKSHTRHRVAWS